MAKAAKKTKSKTKSKPQSKTKLKAKPKTKPKSKVHAKAKPKPAKQVKSKAKAKPTAGAKPARAAAAKATDYSQFFTPLDDRILVLRESFSNRTPGGLYIPDSASGGDRPSQGSVVAVGPGHRDKKGRLRPLDVRIGDKVMFNAFTGSEVKIDTNELLCLRESEIIAVVKE